MQRIYQKHFDSRLKAVSRRKHLRSIAVSIIVILTFLGSLSNRNVTVYTETSSFANQTTEETNSPPHSEIQSTESTDQSSNNETTSTTTSTQLIDPTEEEIAAAKAAGEKAYSETGRSQTFSAVAATANFNGHTIPDGYTVIYAKDGVIVAVNGTMSADKTMLQGVTKAIAFIDNRPDIHNLFIGSTVNGTTTTFPKSIYMGVATAGNTIDSVTPNADKSYSFTPSTWGGLPAGGGISTFSIGIQLANDIPFTGYSIKNGQIVDNKGNISVVPTYQAAAVQVNANQPGTFSYTVNGGIAQTGTYGTTLPGIHVRDKVVITPTAVTGYSFAQTNGSFTALESNVDTVTYTGKQTPITIKYQDYFGQTIAPSKIMNLTYGSAAQDLTTNVPIISGYTFTAVSATETKNQSATSVSASLDTNGNVIVKDANGKQISEVILYYKTNATVSINANGSKYYDGLSVVPIVKYTFNDKTESTSLLNNDLSIDQITWNPTDFKAMNEKGVEVTAPTEIGTYTSWQLTESGLAKLAARTNYLFTIVQTSDIYTIKPISGTVELGGSKTYDGKAGIPSIHVKLAEGITSSVTPVQVTLSNTDYTVDAQSAKNMVDVGSYAIKLTKSGIDKVKAANPKMSFTDIANTSGTYTINKADAVITVDDAAFNYDAQSHSISVGNVHVTGVVSGEALDYTLTANSRTDIGTQIVTISLGEGTVNNNYSITATDTAELTINPTLLLPSTGGIGLLPFVFLGMIFIFSGFFYFIHRKSKAGEQ
ncbi:MBG domain-containing protein [Enterococcus faecium]|uniref:MBG domain-containing protein n=1 Tax=Enterococcus faecium TaxID=1352 RepID=UPI001F09CBE0|nr:MBG domain-containing protein [Enterococcus faecium]